MDMGYSLKPVDTYEIVRPNKPTVRIIQWTKRLASVVIEYKSGRSVIDYPIRYDDGRVAYDNPHAIPQYAKRLVERII